MGSEFEIRIEKIFPELNLRNLNSKILFIIQFKFYLVRLFMFAVMIILKFTDNFSLRYISELFIQYFLKAIILNIIS